MLEYTCVSLHLWPSFLYVVHGCSKFARSKNEAILSIHPGIDLDNDAEHLRVELLHVSIRGQSESPCSSHGWQDRYTASMSDRTQTAVYNYRKWIRVRQGTIHLDLSTIVDYIVDFKCEQICSKLRGKYEELSKLLVRALRCPTSTDSVELSHRTFANVLNQKTCLLNDFVFRRQVAVSLNSSMLARSGSKD